MSVHESGWGRRNQWWFCELDAPGPLQLTEGWGTGLGLRQEVYPLTTI